MAAHLHQRSHPHLRERAPAGPRPLPGRPKAASLASLSATSQQVPSTASSRKPRQNAPGVASVAIGLAVVANSTRNGSQPSRCRARNSEDFAGTCQPPSSPWPRSPSTRCRITSRYGAGGRLFQGPVRAVLVAEGFVLAQGVEKVVLVPGQGPVQKFRAAGLCPVLHE